MTPKRVGFFFTNDPTILVYIMSMVGINALKEERAFERKSPRGFSRDNPVSV